MSETATQSSVSNVSRGGKLASKMAYQTWRLLRGGLVYGSLLYASIEMSEPVTGAVTSQLHMNSPTSLWMGHGFFTLLFFALGYLLMTLMYNVVFSVYKFRFVPRSAPLIKKERKSRSKTRSSRR